MKIGRGLIVCGLAVLLGGCASLSKDECLNADWRVIGFEDGAKGVAKARIGEHRKSCADHGVAPDMAAYDLGYSEGVQTFCTHERGYRAAQFGERRNDVCPGSSDYAGGYDIGIVSFCSVETGYNEGIEGKPYQRVCPPDLERDFLEGYGAGQHIHGLNTQLRDLERRAQEIVREQERNDKRIGEVKGKIAYDDNLKAPDRAKLLEELETLTKRNADLRAEHFGLEHEMGGIRNELSRLGF